PPGPGRLPPRRTRMPRTETHETHSVGDEVSGSFRCDECDLLITSPRENDGVLVLPLCPLCGAEGWRRA
ncbi:MAG: hypothetical protein RJQ03_02810, partial [Miltoncostaeaceae bacterium]